MHLKAVSVDYHEVEKYNQDPPDVNRDEEGLDLQVKSVPQDPREIQLVRRRNLEVRSQGDGARIRTRGQKAN